MFSQCKNWISANNTLGNCSLRLNENFKIQKIDF